MGPSYGGPFQSVRRLAQEQAKAGWQVGVRMPWSQEAEDHLRLWKPATCKVQGRIAIAALGWSRDIAKDLPRSQCEILHTHGLWMHASWVALAWKRRQKRPHVASVRGMLEHWAWNHHAWKKRPIWWLLEYRNLQSASLLHATSDQEAQSIRDRGLHSPIAVIPNGVDVPLLSDLHTHPTKTGAKTVLFLSRIHPKKGLPLLIEAWAKIRPHGWHLKIAGPDEDQHQSEIEHLVNAAGLGNEIFFLGPLQGDQKTQAFVQSDLFVLPTHSENFGIAIAEALAHGLPVITTHGTPWQSLEERECGWWVPTSPDAIALALKTAVELTPDERKTMGLNGRAWMQDRFGWPQIAREMNACYDWLLQRGDKPACIQQVTFKSHK
jgi:glycosyltransferase involved in cell wall biosynthesis